MSDFKVVIPARFASERLPGKPLRDIAGRPMIEHVWRRAGESGASEVVIATDDERIADAAEDFGALVCMTGDQHRSGTERIAEVADLLDWDNGQIVVNLQGDEPAMPPSLIDQGAALLADGDSDMATLASPIQSSEDYLNPNVVKVVVADDGNALYFSRSPIPHLRGGGVPEEALQHHGIYGYRCGVLRQLVAEQPSPLEVSEKLEQLRAMSMGLRIAVGIPDRRPGPGVDTEGDIAAAEAALRQSFPD